MHGKKRTRCQFKKSIAVTMPKNFRFLSHVSIIFRNIFSFYSSGWIFPISFFAHIVLTWETSVAKYMYIYIIHEKRDTRHSTHKYKNDKALFRRKLISSLVNYQRILFLLLL